MNWFQTGKGVHQGCILSPCLFNFYAEYIMWNTRLNDSQPGIKIAGRNINNLTHADDTTLIAKSEEELKSLWWWKRRAKKKKIGLKLNIQKTRIMASSPITSWQIDGKNWKQLQILSSWTQKSLRTVTTAMKVKDTCSLEGKLWQIYTGY